VPAAWPCSGNKGNGFAPFEGAAHHRVDPVPNDLCQLRGRALVIREMGSRRSKVLLITAWIPCRMTCASCVAVLWCFTAISTVAVAAPSACSPPACDAIQNAFQLGFKRVLTISIRGLRGLR
jgi:hypothetical protein